jgi:hypothetical protein
MAEIIGAYHLATNPDLYEVQRNNTFEFVVTDLVGLVTPGDTTLVNAQETLRLSVVKAFIPNFKQQVLEIKRGNTVMKMAGVPTFDAGNLVVRDFIGADTKSVLLAWQKLSFDVKTERIGQMKSYKKKCFLNEYTPDWKLVRSWELSGCFISSITQEEFDMDSGELKNVTAMIEFDKATVLTATEQEI